MNLLRRGLAPLILALTLVFGLSAGPAAAGHGYIGYANNSTIDDDGDARWDISVCFGAEGDSIYANRSSLSLALQSWAGASVGDTSVNGETYSNGIQSKAACNNDGSELQIKWSTTMGHCSLAGGGTVAEMAGSDSSHGPLTMWLNVNCQNAGILDWANPIDYGKAGMPSIVMHEMGHFFGLKHKFGTEVLMDEGGPDICSFWGNAPGITYDDAWHFRARYGGIADTGTQYPPTYCAD